MKKLVLLLSIISLTVIYALKSDNDDPISLYFQEIKASTSHYKDLWNLDLYGPILLVDPSSRKLYANLPDSAGVLKPDGKIFTGTLPADINIANTSIRWNNISWAMIMLPLPEQKPDRLDLLSHELFHRCQPVLGFHTGNFDNNHLDKRDGRIYLRLELAALNKALSASSATDIKDHLTNAIFFRKTRYSLFPEAVSTENKLELNEGMAAYTGNIMSGRNVNELNEFFRNKLIEFMTNPTFVRSFAYMTIPIYGCILKRSDNSWNREITDSTNLTDFFIRKFGISVPVNICPECLNQYGYNEILSEENRREEEKRAQVSAFIKTFVLQPHLVVGLQKMNVSFDPRNLVPLEGYGTVYPTMRISDIWGILTVTEGALLGKNWDKVTLSEPAIITRDSVSGNGWILKLNSGYRVKKNVSGGNYVLEKEDHDIDP